MVKVEYVIMQEPDYVSNGAVENDRKHDDLAMGVHGYKTSWPTKDS